MQSLMTSVKINNEIELCQVDDIDCKQLIERELLKNRISYFVRWLKPSIFSRRKNICIFCVNENSQNDAEAIVRQICEDVGYSVKFLLRKTDNNYL